MTGLLCPTLKRIDKFRIICLFKINKRNTNNVSNMFKNNKDTGTILLTFVLVFLLLSLNIFRTLFYWYNSWIWTNTAGHKKLIALDKKLLSATVTYTLSHGLRKLFGQHIFIVIYPRYGCERNIQWQKFPRQSFKKISETRAYNLTFSTERFSSVVGL